MKWLFKLLGFKSSIDRKREKIKSLREKAFKAQRNGDLSKAGEYLLEAEAIESDIIAGEKNGTKKD